MVGAVAVGLLRGDVSKGVDGASLGGEESGAEFGRFRHAEAGETAACGGCAEGDGGAGIREGVARRFPPPRGVEEDVGGFVGRNDVGASEVDDAIQVHVLRRHAEGAKGVVEIEGAGTEGLILTRRAQRTQRALRRHALG